MKKFLCVLMAAAVLLSLAACAGSTSPEAVARKVVKAIEKNDAEAIMELYHPDYFDYMLRQTEQGYDELLANMEAELERLQDYQIDIVGLENLSKSNRESLQKTFQEEVGLEVENIMAVIVEVYSGEEVYEDKIMVIRVVSRWYLFYF